MRSAAATAMSGKRDSRIKVFIVVAHATSITRREKASRLRLFVRESRDIKKASRARLAFPRSLYQNRFSYDVHLQKPASPSTLWLPGRLASPSSCYSNQRHTLSGRRGRISNRTCSPSSLQRLDERSTRPLPSCRPQAAPPSYGARRRNGQKPASYFRH